METALVLADFYARDVKAGEILKIQVYLYI